MSTRPNWSRFVISIFVLTAITAFTIAAVGPRYYPSLFSVTTVESAAATQSAAAPVTIGTCDTAGPVEVESTGGTTTPTAYATLKDAFDAVIAGTHTGSINIEICGNTTETLSAALTASGIGATSYTDVTIRPVGGARTIEGTITGAIIRLNGADNVTIDGRQGGTGTARDLTVRNNSTATATAAIWLSSVAAANGASGNVIRNLEIAAGQTANTGTNSTFGVYMGGTTISLTSTDGNDNDNNQFLFNRITRARYGVASRGVTTNNSEGLVIADNIIGPTAFGADSIGKAGIYLQADTGAVVTRNTVQFVGGDVASTTAGADRCGICVGSESWSATDSTTITSGNYSVTRNVIHDVIEERLFSSIGIRIGTTRSGSPTSNLIANNFIYNIRSNGTGGDQVLGIGISGGNTDSVVFNSISITGDMDPGTAGAPTTYGNAIRIPGANAANNANFTVANNSIYLDASSSSTAANRYYAITLNGAAYSFGTGALNNNNYYINPGNGQLQTGGLGTNTTSSITTQFATLANWQAALTTPQDAASIQTDPLHFSNTSDLHLQPASPNINVGVTIAGVTDDIDSQSRPNGANPDIGADEFYPSPGTVQLSAATYSITETGGMLTVTATRGGGANGAASVDYTTGGGTATAGGSCGGAVDYVTSAGTLNWADLDAAPKTVNIPICADGVLEASETFNFTLSNPVTVALGSPSAAIATIIDAGSTITGSYNVGSGEGVTSLTNAGGIFQAINNGTVTGNVTINITSDLTGETGLNALNEIAGGFTVTIKPSGAARTITGTTGGAGRGLIGFNSADNVTIDGSLSGGSDRSLTISNTTAGATGGGIYFASGANGAQNNTVKNVNVWGNGATTGMLLGIAVGGTTFGGVGLDNDNNRIENCDVRGSFYGIASLGASAANKDTGLVVTRNVMPSTGTAGIARVGIYVVFNDGGQITENSIASVFNPGSVDSIGIAAGSQALSTTPLATGGISNVTISRNYVGVVSNAATFSSAGIVVASDTTGTNNVVNNMVTGVIGNANAGDILAGIYINGLAGSTQNVYHNSVSMTGDRGSATANLLPSFALAIATDQPTNVANNILFNSQTKTGATGGGGESYAIGFDGPAANLNLISNTNDLFVSGPIGQIGITGDLTTAAQTTTAGTGINRTTLADWQGATSEDAGSISADPLFTSLTDLHIPMGSPVVNVGGTGTGVTNDFDGQTRDAMPDIGADEFIALMPGTLAFSSATYSIGENGGTVTLTVNRTGGSDGTVTVDYGFGGGTATGGGACGGAVDYHNVGSTLSFANGETSKTIMVTICDDMTLEPDETFDVTLSNATGGGVIGMPNPATVTITDNDTPTGPSCEMPSIGNIEVHATAGTMGPTGYATLGDAFTAINTNVHQGEITIDVCGNTTEAATATLTASGVGGTYTSIAIAPVGGARIIEGAVTGAIVRLNGADNVTIDGRIAGAGRNLTIRNNSIAAATAALWLSSVAAGNGASNNVVRNLEIAAGASANVNANVTIGILMSGATVSVTSDGNDNDNNQFVANRITRARYGIVTRGVAANNSLGLVITDNIVGPNSFGSDEIGKAGMLLQMDTGAVVSRNTVQYVGGDLANTLAGTDRCGICIGGENWGHIESAVLTSGDYSVTRNVIHDVVEERTFSAAGIRLGTTRAGAATNNLVANNFIYNIRADGTLGDQPVGIGYAGGHTDRIVFNSVAMTGDMDPGVAAASTIYGAGFRISTVNGTNNANLTMMNNSFYMDVNSNTATVHFYAIALPSAAYVFGTGGLNYNNYYINAANPQMRTGGLGVTSGATPGTEFQTLADWQGALTTPQDANSIQADPLYFLPTVDLHIQQASPNVNVGTAIAGIADDIDGQMRPNGANPDIGADEFYPSGGSVALSAASYSVVETGGMVAVTVYRLGGANGAASVDYSTGGGTATPGGACGGAVDYVTTAGTLNWADLDAAPKTINIPVCADGVIESIENFNVTLSNPMTVTLGSPSTATVNILDAGSTINGTINVGTGETLTSLTNPGGVFDVINAGMVTGNITINITSNLTGETGTILLNEIGGAFTVLIKPSGEARTVTGTSNGTSGLLGFNATDRVTIDGSLAGGTDRSLTINNQIATNAGGGIYFASGTNGAQNNTVKNVNVWGGGATTGSLLGIAFASTTFGGVGLDSDNNRIENNDVRGAFYGIAVLGASAANQNTGTVITKNVMPATGAAGIGRIGVYLINDDGAQVTENTIGSVSSGAAADCIGLAIGNQNIALTAPVPADVTNALVARNSIGVVSNTASNSSIGIVLASGVTGTNTVVNNMISGVVGNSTATNFVAGIYVIPRAGAMQNIYHNSVSMTGERGTTANQTPSFGIAISADQPVNLVNNVLTNSQTRTGATGGGGESYAIGFDGPAANVNLASNYNDLFVSGPLGQVGITGDLTTAAQTTTAGTGTNRTTLTDWQTATGEDANSLAVDPQFVSSTNLHLQMGSPMINAGTNVGVTNDFDGDARVGTPDIGADEIPGVAVPGVLQFSAPTYTVGEAGPTATITVTRTGGSDGTVTVDYATVAGGTATGGASCTAGIDYVTTNGTLTFVNGDTSETFNITICQDAADEPDETVNLALTNPTGGATIGAQNTAVLTITDDDVPPTAFSVAISDARVVEGDAGTANLVFNVTLTSSLPPLTSLGGVVASVQYATANGTATAGSDYTAAMGTINFASPGTQMVTVQVSGDVVKESNEFMFVNLSNPSPNTVITDGQGAGIIVDEDRPYVADFDRDRKADYSVYRPSSGDWYVLRSTDSQMTIGSAGPSGDTAVPGDYDGDGKTDIAVFQGSAGNWFILRSSDSTTVVTQWGITADKPVQGDYDKDGKADLAVYRPSTGTWWVLRSSNGSSFAVPFGLSGDRPVQGDYDGDAQTDFAVYRNGTWYIFRSSDSNVQIGNWGLASDKPVSGDFDGDGRHDLAIYRDGTWWILNSLSGSFTAQPYGLSTDIPAPADFDGDGSTDRVVFRPSTGDWYVLPSLVPNSTGVHWGTSGDVPIPSAYIPQ